MKILIVDDEALLRQNLRAMLKASSLAIDEFLMAENAIEAITLVKERQPDIVLSDIRMPAKSGLELAAYIYENHPDLPVILVTGYSDFGYAQAAVKNRVFDYILKPVESDKLIASVARAKQKLDLHKKHEHLYQVFREYFNDNLKAVQKQYIETLLFHGSAVPYANQQREAFQLDFRRFRLVAVSCGTAVGNNQLESQYYCTYLVDKYIREVCPDTVTYIFGSLVFFLWEVKVPDRFEDNRQLLALLGSLLSFARNHFAGVLSAGISQISESFANMPNLRRQTSECLEMAREKGRENFLFFEDIMEPNQESWEMEDNARTLAALVRAGNVSAALERFDALAEKLADSPYYITVCLLTVSQISFMLHELGIEAGRVAEMTGRILPHLNENDPRRYTQKLRQWLGDIARLISGELQDRSNFVVNGVKDFINAHYSEPVGLVEAARYVDRNPSYVSRLVKEHTGKNFTQLLTDKRMAEAKRLLTGTNLKITEIAQRVGYVNVRYFNRVFKAATNVSANDYRNFSAAFQGNE